MSHDRIEVSRTIAADPTAVWSGVDDRETHNRAGMEATLERLAAALEA